MSEISIYEEILEVLRKRAKAPHEYINPNFLSGVNSLIDTYGKIEDDEVDSWIADMWGC